MILRYFAYFVPRESLLYEKLAMQNAAFLYIYITIKLICSVIRNMAIEYKIYFTYYQDIKKILLIFEISYYQIYTASILDFLAPELLKKLSIIVSFILFFKPTPNEKSSMY